MSEQTGSNTDRADKPARGSGRTTMKEQLAALQDFVAKGVRPSKEEYPADVVRDDRVPEFYGFEGGADHVFSIDKKGGLIRRKLRWAEEAATVRGASSKTAFSLPISAAGVRGAYPIRPSLVPVSGGTKVGKSRLTRALAQKMLTYRVLAVEPYDSGDEIDTVPCFSSVDAALAHLIKRYYTTERHDELFVLDSLRAPVFETTGPAGSKGVIMPFFTQLTRVSNALTKAGITVLAPVNPMNSDDDFTAEFLKNLTASTMDVILITEQRTEGREDVFAGRMVSRPRRAHVPFELRVPSSGEPLTAWSSEQADLLSEVVYEAVHLDDDQDPLVTKALSTAIQRSI